MDIDQNVCSIHFLGVPINFDPIGKCKRSPKVIDIGKSVYFIYPDYLKIFTEVMFTNEFHFYLMDMVPNVDSIQFPDVPKYFDHIGIWQRSPKVMKVGKSAYFTYPWFLKMFTVLMFIIEFHYYLMDMVPNGCSIQFLNVPKYFDHIGICQRSPKVMKDGKIVYFIYPGFLNMFTMVMFINEFDYLCMDMVPNVCSIQFPGVPNCFNYIYILQRSPEVMKVGKSVYFIYPGFL